MVTHPCINWAHDCLTSVIKRKTFAPCYVSPLKSPLKKPEPSAPMLPWMLRPCALQLSREQRSPTSEPSKKPRPPAPAPSGRPKPLALWPSGMQRPGGLSGLVTPKATWQSHPRPGGTSHLRERQKPNWLPLCLSGCPTCQPSGTQRCAGSLLSHFVGAGPHVPPIHLITRGLPSWATVCPSVSSHTSAQAVL